jgi:glycosyltransferase involved in cell wall biosynthesis
VTVIIPTLAASGRAKLLIRAIDSVHGQQDVRANALIVLNGSVNDAQLVATLRQDSRLRILTTPPPDLPGALRLGRAHVDTPWFTALDDDDVLLPSALRIRLSALMGQPDSVVVVTNGWRRDGQGDTLHMLSFDSVRRDPLRSILAGNWLLPGAWLARTDAFADEVFARMPRYLECTYLAVRFATTHHACFIDEPTVAWSADTPGSVSKSREYVLGLEGALERILELDLPADVRRGFKRKLASAQQAAAGLLLQEGHARAAWDTHLRSLRNPSGWRFISSTPQFFLRRSRQ